MALADSAALQAVRDWCVANFSKTKRVEFDSGAVSWSSGTVGTRAAQLLVDVTDSGWKPVAVSISYVQASSTFHPLVFFSNTASTSNFDGVYCNFYRCTTSSYSNDYPLRFVVEYVKI